MSDLLIFNQIVKMSSLEIIVILLVVLVVLGCFIAIGVKCLCSRQSASVVENDVESEYGRTQVDGGIVTGKRHFEEVSFEDVNLLLDIPELGCINVYSDLLTHDELAAVVRYLQTFQISKDIYDRVSSWDSVQAIRVCQNLLIRNHNLRPISAHNQSCLVIGVDARPKEAAGYCINLQEKTIQWYLIQRKNYPWIVECEGSSEEFEMRNLEFALALWSHTIRTYKNFMLFTDNYAMNKSTSHYGSEARCLVDHFTKCENIQKLNNDEHVNRTNDIKRFATYIQPADDISRWNIDRGIHFLSEFYQIPMGNVEGTHILEQKRTKYSNARYDQNVNYQKYIDQVKEVARKLQCENCNVKIFSTGPGRSTSIPRSRWESGPRSR